MVNLYVDIIREFEKHGKKLERALALVKSKRVKVHRFNPSKREIWTVVGRGGDQIVIEDQNYCSCNHFHYKVLSGEDNICQHILSLKIAKRLNEFNIFNFFDDNYMSFMKSLLKDLSRE